MILSQHFAHVKVVDGVAPSGRAIEFARQTQHRIRSGIAMQSPEIVD